MAERESIVVSACLLGEACRYDAKSQPCDAVLALAREYDLVPVCPEQLGGLPTPRTPSEIQPDGRVIDRKGTDRTHAFSQGAHAALRIANEHCCKRAILKAKSPSCGSRLVYDGTFSGSLVEGEGVAAALFRENGLEVADENGFAEQFGIARPETGQDPAASLRPSSRPPQLRRIVITGGPCAGKTTALEALRERFGAAGMQAVFVAEAATDLILAGVAPWTCESMLEFQTRVIALQIEREAEADDRAWQRGASLVICDRGICDSHAYLSDEEYACALEANSLDDATALARYDAVFHLESVAKASLDSYTRANNSARFETAEEAVAADDRVVAAWSAHPNRLLIANEPSFDLKAENLFSALKPFQV